MDVLHNPDLNTLCIKLLNMFKFQGCGDLRLQEISGDLRGEEKVTFCRSRRGELFGWLEFSGELSGDLREFQDIP